MSKTRCLKALLCFLVMKIAFYGSHIDLGFAALFRLYIFCFRDGGFSVWIEKRRNSRTESISDDKISDAGLSICNKIAFRTEKAAIFREYMDKSFFLLGFSHKNICRKLLLLCARNLKYEYGFC